jgi:hypothetical protein
VSAGIIYTDLASTVIGSAISDDAGGVLLGVFLEGHQTEQKLFLRASFVFNRPGSPSGGFAENFIRYRNYEKRPGGLAALKILSRI